MPRITDYASLGQSIIDFTHRSDLAPYMDYFIQLGESRIYRDILTQNMGQGIRLMEASLTGTLTTGTLAVPADFLALKSMQVVDGGGGVNTLQYKDAQWIYSQYPLRQSQGLPGYVARDGANFVFGPYPDSGYSITGTYYQQGTGLTSLNTTTWMSTSAPDVLLAACMLELQPFLLDDSKTAGWQAMYESKLNSLIVQDAAEKWAPAVMAIQVG